MSSSTINQGAINDIIIKPIWGTIDKQEEANKEDRFIAIVNDIAKRLDSKADIVHDHDTRYYTKTETDTKLNGKVTKTGDTMTGDLDIQNNDLDNTDQSRATGTAKYLLFKDKNSKAVGFVGVDMSVSAILFTSLASRRWNGNTVVDNYLRLVVNKDFTKEVIVSDPDAWRTGINAAAANHTHDTQYYTKTETDTKLSGKMAVTPAAIEMVPPSTASYGGFIDFHYAGNTSADYTARIIERQDNLQILGKPVSVKTSVDGSSSTGYRNALEVRDGNDALVGSVRSLWSGSEKHNRGIALYVVRGNVENVLVLAINDDGARKVVVTDQAAWQEGLNFLSQAGGTMTGYLTLNGKDLRLKTTGSTSDDASDIVWYYGNDQERMRIWASTTEPTAKIGPNYRVYKKDGTALFNGTLALYELENITVTYASGVVAQSGGNGLGCKRYGNVYVLNLSVQLTKSANSGWFKLCSIASTHAPANTMYDLAHNFSLSYNEVQLVGGSTGGAINIDHSAACTNKIIRFSFTWIK